MIIYLGNCDSASNEIRKSRYTKKRHFVQRVKERVGVVPQRTRLQNKLLYFEWNDSFNPQIEKSESPQDYRYNLERIIRDCLSKSINVVLVKPRANRNFPAGLGKGNFSFYRYMGLDDRISDTLSIADKRFISAYALHEDGKLEEACAAYRAILLNTDPQLRNPEFPLVLMNNIAVAKAEQGLIDEALLLFELLLKERNGRSEIFLYNMAMIYRSIGKMVLYEEYLNKAFEADTSMYRIRSPYRDALNELASSFPAMKIVDMGTNYADNLFLDHCHLLPDGHKKLASDICDKLVTTTTKGGHKASLKNMLFNPEAFCGNKSEFFDYFRSFPDISEKEINSNLRRVDTLLEFTGKANLSPVQMSSFPLSFKSAFEYYSRHPLFRNHARIRNMPPREPVDLGRFPEFFLVRLLIPYLEHYEALPDGEKLFSAKFPGLRDGRRMRNILPEQVRSFVDAEPDFNICNDMAAYVGEIVENVRHSLIEQCKNGCIIGKRRKSTIFWYVRETLRFGSHSRSSMLYDRVAHEFMAEGLLVACLLDRRFALGFGDAIKNLARQIEKAVELHETYCLEYMANTFDFHPSHYESALAAVSNQVDGAGRN